MNINFFRLGHDIYRFLNNFFRENGVNVAKDNKTISKRLVGVLQKETPPTWTLEQFQEQKFIKGGVSERFNPFFESVNVPIQDVTQHPNVQQQWQDLQSEKQEYIDSKIADAKLDIKQNNHSSNNVPQISIPTYNVNMSILKNADIEDLPAIEAPEGFHMRLTVLEKFYYDKSKQYSGKLFDILDKKLKIF